MILSHSGRCAPRTGVPSCCASSETRHRMEMRCALGGAVPSAERVSWTRWRAYTCIGVGRVRHLERHRLTVGTDPVRGHHNNDQGGCRAPGQHPTGEAHTRPSTTLAATSFTDHPASMWWGSWRDLFTLGELHRRPVWLWPTGHPSEPSVASNRVSRDRPVDVRQPRSTSGRSSGWEDCKGVGLAQSRMTDVEKH